MQLTSNLHPPKYGGCIEKAAKQKTELKYNFGFDSINLKNFYATEAPLIFAIITYNLMALF